MNKKHAKLGASTSDIWMNCSGAPALWGKITEPPLDSPYALEGTAAHELGEKWIKAKLKGKPFNPLDHATPATVKAVKVYVDEVLKNKTADLILIEEKVSLEGLVAPDMFGTVDAGIIHRHFDTLEVVDYKHGRGVKVEIEKEYANGRRTLNTQAVYYALGLAYRFHFNFRYVVLKIVQPRCEQGTPITSTRVTIDELYSYIDVFKNAVKNAEQINAKRSPGPWCRFCKAKAICREAKNGYRTDARKDFYE